MNSRLGCYGKIPSVADFVQHGLSNEFSGPWHAWMETSLAISQAQLQDHWLDYYLVAPIWHFALAARTCGPAAITGVWVPSVDRVGRYYPFILAQTDAPPPAQALTAPTDWHQQLESIALYALDEHTSLAQLLERMQHIPELTQHSDADTFYWPHAEHAPSQTLRQLAISAVNPAGGLLQALLSAGGPQISLWWTQGSEHVAPVCLSCDGLPPAASFAALLDGQWQRWGWHAGVITDSTRAGTHT